MDKSESDNELVDTPLVFPFLDSDDELGDDEVLNELDEYENVGLFFRNRIINSVDGNDLAFPCMIGLESTGRNLVAIVRDVYVFVGSFTYVTKFVVLEDTREFIVSDMIDVVMGRPFRVVSQLKYDCVKGLISFTKIFDTYIFRMPRTIPRLKNFDWSKVLPILALSQRDLMSGLKYSHEKNKLMYTNCLNLGPEYQVDEVIMEYLVKISKKARILELKRRHLTKLTLTSYTPYPSRKIRRICACTSQKTTRIQDQYAEDLKTKFLSKCCPPARTAKKMEEINNLQQEPDETLYQAWERFKELLMKCPQHYLTEMQEVVLFYNGLDVLTRQILDSKGDIATKTVADAKVTIQEMVEYSKKWNNGTSRTRSTETSDGLAAIQAQLNNLGREITKMLPNAPFQQGGKYRVAAPGFYQRNNADPSYQERRQSMEESLSKFMNSNQANEQSITGKGFGSLPSSTETNPRDHVKSISTTVEADMTPIRRIRSSQYVVSAQQNRASIGAVKYPKGIAENVLEGRDVIVGEPLCKASCVESRRVDEIITIHNGNDNVTYQMARSHPRFKHLSNAQCNKIKLLLKVSPYGVFQFMDTVTSLEKKSTKLVKYRSSGILCVL
ncbi:homeodomain-like protein [Tanacetum coccineum]